MSIHGARRGLERVDCGSNAHDQPLDHFIQHQPVDRADREYRVAVLDPAMVSRRDLADQLLDFNGHRMASPPAGSAFPFAQTVPAESFEDVVCYSSCVW